MASVRIALAALGLKYASGSTLGTEANPAPSCQCLSDQPSGSYWISVQGKKIKVKCNNDDADGGWTQLAFNKGFTKVFGPHWQNILSTDWLANSTSADMAFQNLPGGEYLRSDLWILLNTLQDFEFTQVLVHDGNQLQQLKVAPALSSTSLRNVAAQPNPVLPLHNSAGANTGMLALMGRAGDHSREHCYYPSIDGTGCEQWYAGDVQSQMTLFSVGSVAHCPKATDPSGWVGRVLGSSDCYEDNTWGGLVSAWSKRPYNNNGATTGGHNNQGTSVWLRGADDRCPKPPSASDAVLNFDDSASMWRDSASPSLHVDEPLYVRNRRVLVEADLGRCQRRTSAKESLFLETFDEKDASILKTAWNINYELNVVSSPLGGKRTDMKCSGSNTNQYVIGNHAVPPPPAGVEPSHIYLRGIMAAPSTTHNSGYYLKIGGRDIWIWSCGTSGCVHGQAGWPGSPVWYADIRSFYPKLGNLGILYLETIKPDIDYEFSIELDLEEGLLTIKWKSFDDMQVKTKQVDVSGAPQVKQFDNMSLHLWQDHRAWCDEGTYIDEIEVLYRAR